MTGVRWWWIPLVGALLVGCPRDDRETQEPASPSPATGTQAVGSPQAPGAQADLGRQVFAQQCANCHGPGGAGDGPAAAALKPKPRNLTVASAYRFGAGREAVEKTIRNGVQGSAMPAFSAVLTDAQTEAVADFVVKLQTK